MPANTNQLSLAPGQSLPRSVSAPVRTAGTTEIQSHYLPLYPPTATTPIPTPITPTLDNYQTSVEISSVSSASVSDGEDSEDVQNGMVDGEEVERRIEELLRTPGDISVIGKGQRNIGRRSYSLGAWGGCKKNVGVIGNKIGIISNNSGTDNSVIYGMMGANNNNNIMMRLAMMMDDKISLDEFKVRRCPDVEQCLQQDLVSECPYWHNQNDRRRMPSLNKYRPILCRFGLECRKGDLCTYSHNDYERRYHPTRWRQETCRDFLRGDCPRRYCTFQHEVSEKVENALREIYRMDDKEMLQFVLKIAEVKGRPLHEKMMRRFCGAGHKKHSGWILDGCKDDQVRGLMERVEEIKKRLKVGGELRWANLIRITGLRDMMSGVRKVTEEIRERLKGNVEKTEDPYKLIRTVFSNTNWSCHSQEGTNPFIVTPTNQNEALTSLEKLVEHVFAAKQTIAATQAATPLQVNKNMLYPASNMATSIAVPNWA